MASIYKTLFENQLINEYLNLIYKRYILTQPGLTAIYYNVNPDESVWDNDLKATYNRPGSVNLTGMKFDKYMNIMLIFGTRTQRSVNDSQNYGINSYETQFQIFLPSVFNINPNPNDYIVFSPNPEGEQKSYVVIGIESATIGQQPNHTGWYLTVKPYYIEEDTIESNVVTTKVFNPILFTYQDVDTYNSYMKAVISLTNLINLLNNKFSQSLVTYVDQYGNIYKQFDSLIAWIRQQLPDYIQQNVLLPYSSTYDQSFIDTFESFLTDYDAAKLNLKDVTVRDSIKSASTVEDIFTLSQDQSLNTLEIFVLLYKLIKLEVF